jgi:hypothetical protein
VKFQTVPCEKRPDCIAARFADGGRHKTESRK